jgi:hypothetical protein
MKSLAAGSFCALLLSLCACGPSMPAGQSNLSEQTFAGQNECNPKSHDRPFIIEWDATDMSSFEAHAANDVVVARYEGCELKVLDQCRNDSVRGQLGAYKPVEWTSGSLEKLEISSEEDLYAKLPLGAATLGGRVSHGEKFRMEYYVAGTRSATRDAVYASDLADLPGCKGATHFVYGYNLGAFALGTVTETNIEAEGSLYGFGAGGGKKTSTSADKKGGELPTCKSDSAKEIEGCKVPIRLTLREVQAGENPDKEAMKAPDTDESLNAAGKLAAKMDMSDEARARYEAATQKSSSGDGAGCLKELDAHDKLDPKHKSSDPKSGLGYQRAICLMQAGQCDPGKQLLRKSLEATQGNQTSPEQIDRTVDALAGRSCQGGNLSARDQVLKALADLQQGAYMTKKDAAFCMKAYETAKRLGPSVKPRDDEDQQILSMDRTLGFTTATCLGRAGDCDAAYKVYVESQPKEAKEGYAKIKDAKQREQIIRSSFETVVQKCKK